MKPYDLPLEMESIMPAAIELHALGKRYGDHEVVSHIDLKLPPKSFLVLLGPSGCGKSTLLRMLSGLEAPTSGSLSIHGREVANGAQGILVPPGARGLGLVFQSYALWPHMTVRGNIEWPLKIAKLPVAERRQRVDSVLSLLGISALAERYPSEISGGQQQRVAIARMLSPAPGLLLFDEPLSNLDAKLRLEMRSELLRVHRQTGATSVYVTHDQVEAMTMATHVAVMNGGVIQQFGPPQELLENPATAFVATFIGTPAANVLPVEARNGRYHFQDIPLAAVDGGPDKAQLLYRATELTLSTEPGDGSKPGAPATLIEVAPMAGGYVCTLMLAGTRVSVVSSVPPPAVSGDTLHLTFPASPRIRFDAEGQRLDNKNPS
ncbi:MAG: ABC transporter ATP-binding protein [Lautropia sp.]|nr:ABC transporter ATP-binding protein [Lautropia sp.]